MIVTKMSWATGLRDGHKNTTGQLGGYGSLGRFRFDRDRLVDKVRQRRLCHDNVGFVSGAWYSRSIRDWTRDWRMVIDTSLARNRNTLNSIPSLDLPGDATKNVYELLVVRTERLCTHFDVAKGRDKSLGVRIQVE
jgi:hypothetical protein